MVLQTLEVRLRVEVTLKMTVWMLLEKIGKRKILLKILVLVCLLSPSREKVLIITKRGKVQNRMEMKQMHP